MKVQKFLHAAFRHFGDVWAWADGGNGSGLGGILECLDVTGGNFESVLNDLFVYMSQHDVTEMYSLDRQRYTESTWQLTATGHVVLQDGLPQKCRTAEKDDDSDDEFGHKRTTQHSGHPWVATTLFYFRWWWHDVPPELAKQYESLDQRDNMMEQWVQLLQSPATPG